MKVTELEMTLEAVASERDKARELQATNAELLEALESLVGEDGDLFSDEAHSKAREAIRKARER